MSTKSKIAIALFILQIISTAGIVIGTSKDYLGALASAIGLSIFMIIAAVLVLVDNKKMYEKIKEIKQKSCSIETKNQIEQNKSSSNNTDNYVDNNNSLPTTKQKVIVLICIIFMIVIILIPAFVN